MPTIPHLVPPVDVPPAVPIDSSDPSAFFTYDLTIGGLGFRLASDQDKPLIWETAPYSKQQIDQATEPGEQTLSNWWMKSQSSFHGGAGQLHLERIDLPPANTHIRFDASKNCDVWTPGRVTRLPDTSVLTSETATSMVGVEVGGVDRLVYVNQSNQLVRNLVSPTTSAVFTGVTESVYSVCTDGTNCYAAGNTGVWKVDPNVIGAASKIYSYAADTTPVVAWVKSRLMLSTAGGVYELDCNAAPTVALGVGQLRYQHPARGWLWRCFAETPAGIIAAGDAVNRSEIVKFDLDTTGATPVLVAGASLATMPAGERILSMTSALGSFIALGTTSGLRVAQIQALYGYLTVGPLTVPESESHQPVNGVVTRDRFIYGASYAQDEPGLIRLDTGTVTDQAGRFAYASDLVAPSVPPNLTLTSTAVCILPIGGKLAFSVPGVGLCLEGTGAGTLRPAWLRTSRIRYGTTEPKLFKFGRVRGDLSTGSIQVSAITPTNTVSAGLVGFETDDPGEFALPAGSYEWLQLKMELFGGPVMLTSYGVKALPGLPRQRIIQVNCMCMDRETDRRGHRFTDIGSARRRMEALFALDAASDEVLLQEFTLQGAITRRVLIEQVTFKETGRPTNTSDFGGEVTITMRTIA